MAAAVVDLVNKPSDDPTANRSIELGATYRATIFWKTGTPAVAVNLTGYTARSMFKASPVREASQIIGITKANPAVVTTKAAHGLKTGASVVLPNVGGMTQVAGVRYTITVISATTFSIGVDSTSYTTYTSGGSVAYVSLVNVTAVSALEGLILGTTLGDIVIYIKDTTTDVMPLGGVYDLELVNVNGDVTRVVQGVFSSSLNVTA